MFLFADMVPRAIGALVLLALATRCARSQESAPAWRPFEIRCVDASTGEGIPLVTLETVHAVSYVTDNAGRIAYDEPQHAGQKIFFKILAHGYVVPRDAFDAAGVVVSIASGGRHEIRLERQQAAERLARLTGADRYRDSRMLGYETPRDDGLGAGAVAGVSGGRRLSRCRQTAEHDNQHQGRPGQAHQFAPPPPRSAASRPH